MRFVIFTHSLVSDWNHGNAHFLRGIALELLSRNHRLTIFEPSDGWSRENLIREHGQKAIDDFRSAFPELDSTLYDEASIDFSEALRDADIVIVHEWNSPELIAGIGKHRARHDYLLFFHDTHHRSLTEPHSMARYDLTNYDGVLAYGKVIRDFYLKRNWARCAFTWHEAADIRTFYPRTATEEKADLAWIGNWGDGERAATLREYLIEPVRRLRLRATVYGVRYPQEALDELAGAGISYGGWLPNYRAPAVFANHRVTIHVPRGPYVHSLPGIPTIRPFEALACAIPLVCAPWHDSEQLFSSGEDFLFAHDTDEMTSTLAELLGNQRLSDSLANHGMSTIRQKHTCAHRVDQLLTIAQSMTNEPAIEEIV